MSFLQYDKLVTYAYDTSSFIFGSLKGQGRMALEMICHNLHVKAFFSTQMNTTYMRIYHKYYDLKKHKEVEINIKNKIGISLIEGHIRHLFKGSEVRNIFFPSELNFMLPYIMKQDYIKYFKIYDNFMEFHEASVNHKLRLFSTLALVRSRSILQSSFARYRDRIIEMRLIEEKKHMDEEIYMNKIKICQRCIRKWLIKRRLRKQIGSNMVRLLERKERNLRCLNDDNTITLKDVKFIFSPIREVYIQRFEIDQHMIDKELLLDYWMNFINNTMPAFDGSLKDRVYRTIINHAKFNSEILHWKMSYSQHSSSFCLFYHRSDNSLLEIDGQIYRSIGRCKIAKLYDKFQVHKSKYPVKPYGSLYNTIARGIHSHFSYNLIHGIIDKKVLSNNQRLFWVKYGNRKKQDVAIVIKNVHWVRKGHDYEHKVGLNRFQHDKDDGFTTFSIHRDGIFIDGSLINHELNDWVKTLYEKSDDKVSWYINN
jgi:hypothetical protein